jgi:hydroxypyruvate isomerase
MLRRGFLRTATLTLGGVGTGILGGRAPLEGAEAPRPGPAPGPAAAKPFQLRYACELNWLEKELTIPQRLDLFKAHGFTAVEYNGLLKHAISEVADLRRELDARGMDMGIFVANPGGWNRAGVVDPQQHPAFLEEIRRAIEYHKVVKNRSVTTLTGMVLPGVSRSTQRRNCVEGFKKAAEILAGTELALVVEPLNHIDHPGFFMTRADELAEVIAQVDSPSVRMLYDFYHLQVTQGNVIRDFEQYYDLVGYVQTGDVPGRKEPGTGETNYRNVFKAVHAKGYRGMVGMEHGFSVPGREGFLRCVKAYREADDFTAAPG